MNATLAKFLLFVLIIAAAVGISLGIQAAVDEAEEDAPLDTRPTVSIETMSPISHQVKISSFGEVIPLESTVLAAQVNGEVISWNPKFVAGGVVERGEVLFTIEADQYEAAILQAQAQVSLSEATLTEELAMQKVAMREAKNIAKNRVTDLYLRKPQVLSAQAQLKSAKAALRIANRNLDKTKVLAPYDALVMSREIGSGQYVSAGMRVASLYNIESAEIIVPIAGFDSPFLLSDMNGTEAMVKTKSNSPVQRSGFVSRDLGVLDQATRMLNVVIRIDDPYGLKSDAPPIKFGSYVEVEIAGKQLENVFKVPQALVNNGKLWLLDEEDKLIAHDVEVVREEGSFFYISSGVEANDRMVKDLPEYPQNGMQVKIEGAAQALLSYHNTNNNG